MPRPPLSVEQILAWADAHCARTGSWPTPHSGPVPEAPGETWSAVQAALYQALRGLPGGGSLARLLNRERGARRRSCRPWTQREEELVRTLGPAEAARRTGRTMTAVYQRRRDLGLARRR
jgi:hypothetical protein